MTGPRALSLRLCLLCGRLRTGSLRQHRANFLCRPPPGLRLIGQNVQHRFQILSVGFAQRRTRALDTDESRDVVARYIEKQKYTFPVLLAGQEVLDLYDIHLYRALLSLIGTAW
jgi:hypothetical protein